MRERDLHIIQNLCDSVGALYNDGILAVTTKAMHAHANRWRGGLGVGLARMQQIGRAHYPRPLLTTGPVVLWVTYEAGRWSWAPLSKRAGACAMRAARMTDCGRE
jgi:hypothetical protein